MVTQWNKYRDVLNSFAPYWVVVGVAIQAAHCCVDGGIK